MSIYFTERPTNEETAMIDAGSKIERKTKDFDVFVDISKCGTVTLVSNKRGYTWKDERELVCEAAQALETIDDVLHKCEDIDDEPDDDYDHYRGYCPNCETEFKDIAMWNKNGTKHHSVYYCPNCGAELAPPTPTHIEPII